MKHQCSGSNSCPGPCRFVISRGFPVNYYSNEKCSWSIEVDQKSYIQLTFTHFDVFEEETNLCEKDHVALYNVRSSSNDASGILGLIKLFCNTNKPPGVIYSNWNRMVVEFNTDFSNKRSGFIKYQPNLNTGQSNISNG